ncbi:MAG: prolipoprotein diacylglyceryl transferase [Cyclobacteriaceae bacterium]|nr:prolipoprotein diacylglyceryl transferase [Cyclobacteriaceae bacterium HetDA_MAG_MS6]
MDRLKEKWEIQSTYQFVMIMVVFACTGTSVVFLKKPIIGFFTVDGEQPLWFTIAYWVFILPIYNVILLFYGFVLGQFSFFWAYEKRMIGRFSRKRNATPQE